MRRSTVAAHVVQVKRPTTRKSRITTVIVQISGVVVGAVLGWGFRHLPPLLRAAVFAQIADLATFAIVWNDFQEERNPLANLILQTVIGLTGGPESALSTTFAGLVLIGLKCALIAYLIWAAPRLARYQTAVLVVATGAGLIGALSNFRLFGIFIGPENIPLLGVVIADASARNTYFPSAQYPHQHRQPSHRRDEPPVVD